METGQSNPKRIEGRNKRDMTRWSVVRCEYKAGHSKPVPVDTEALVLCTTHTHKHASTCPQPHIVSIIHQCQYVILDELTVVANYDACVSESLNKNDHGKAVRLNSGKNAVGADVSPRVGGIRPWMGQS